MKQAITGYFWGIYVTRIPLELISWNQDLGIFETLVGGDVEYHPADPDVFRNPGNDFGKKNCKKFGLLTTHNVNLADVFRAAGVLDFPSLVEVY